MGIETGDILRRSLGLRTVVSTSAGLTFASSTFLVVVQIGLLMPGDAGWIPVVIAGLLCCLAAAAFSELNGMYPTQAGVRLYIQRAFGEKVALVASLTYMSVVTLVVGAEAYVLSHVLHAALPAIAPPVWILIMLTLATLANYRGVKVAGTLQDVITYSVVTSIVVMSVVALMGSHAQVRHPLTTGGPVSVFTAVGLAIFLFVGFEWVTPLADEVRSPQHISRGMFMALTLLAAVYALITTAMFSLPGAGAAYGGAAHLNPIPHLVWAAAALGPIGRGCMIATSLGMSLTTFNAGLLSVSRFIQMCAKDNVLPRFLADYSPRFMTPRSAIFAVYVIALVVSLWVWWSDRYVMLVNSAAAVESFIYALAGASVLALRIKQSDRERPFRMAGGRVLPAVTALLFLGVGIGVFFAEPNVEYWGAAVILGLVAVGWWAYLRLFALPRMERIRAEQAALREAERSTRRETRRSRRPAAPLVDVAVVRPDTASGPGAAESEAPVKEQAETRE